jgi:hypothetical protein
MTVTYGRGVGTYILYGTRREEKKEKNVKDNERKKENLESLRR